MPNFMELAKRVSPKGWAMIGGSIAVGLVFLVILMHVASAPSYTTLEAGIDPTQTGKIGSTLSAQGISYELQNGGTAVAVQSSQTAQARVALATAGLLTSQQPGFSLLNSSQLGQSNFQQQVTYERALEGQLASTIDSISGVNSATVNLALPNSQDQLFSDSTEPTTANVLIGTNSLSSAQVRGIAQLVASSVPGLSINKVTVTGADGSQLWPGSASSDTGGLLSEESASQKYDSTMDTEVDNMLAQTLGAGKAQVVINANVNANTATQQSLTYDKKSAVPLTQSTSTETLKGAGASAAGAAGTASNVTAYTSSTGSGSGNSNYNDKTTNTSYGVNKTITTSTIAPGAINQQSVSVLVDKSVPASELPAIKAAVANAVGLQPKRGDTMSVGQLAFAKQATPTTTPTANATSSYMKYAKYGLAGLGSLIFLVFSGRMLRRRERESFGQPTWLRELESPRSLASLEQRAAGNGGAVVAGDPTEVMALRSPVNVAKRQVEDLVQRDPERVAQQVRAWMSEE